MPSWPMAMPSSTPMVLNSKGTAARFADGLLDQAAEALEVGVAGHDVDVGVHDGDERLAHVGVGHPHRLEQAAVRSALDSRLDPVRSHPKTPQKQKPPRFPSGAFLISTCLA